MIPFNRHKNTLTKRKYSCKKNLHEYKLQEFKQGQVKKYLKKEYGRKKDNSEKSMQSLTHWAKYNLIYIQTPPLLHVNRLSTSE